VNYDKIIIELLDRIKNLETKVDRINEQINLKNEISTEVIEEKNSITRSQARDKAMNEIMKRYPDYFVDRARREEGNGIKILTPYKGGNTGVIIKFIYSKIYNNADGSKSYWHKVNLDEVIGSYYSFVMFALMDENGLFNFFVFKPDELGIYRDNNRKKTDNPILHLYFKINNNKAFEVREEKVDVTDKLNDWSVFDEEQLYK